MIGNTIVGSQAYCQQGGIRSSDKNSLFERGSIGETGLCVNFNVYTPYCGWGLGADDFLMSVEASILWTGI